MTGERESLFDRRKPNAWLDGVESRAEDMGDGWVRVPRSDWEGVIGSFKMGEGITATFEEALAEIRDSDGIPNVEGCSCGHKRDFCHRWNAGRYCGAFSAPRRADTALREVMPDG